MNEETDGIVKTALYSCDNSYYVIYTKYNVLHNVDGKPAIIYYYENKTIKSEHWYYMGKKVNNALGYSDIYYDDIQHMRKLIKIIADDRFTEINFSKDSRVKSIKYYKNNMLHRDDAPAFYKYYKNGRAKSIYWYENGELLNVKPSKISAQFSQHNKKWWNFITPHQVLYGLEIQIDGIYKKEYYDNELYSTFIERYDNDNICTCIKKHKESSQLFIEYYNPGGVLYSKSLTVYIPSINNSIHHNTILDCPSHIIYYENRSIKSEEWFIDGKPGRTKFNDDGSPNINRNTICIEYSENGSVLKKHYVNYPDEENSDYPDIETYYPSGNVMQQTWCKSGSVTVHRENDKPAMILYHDKVETDETNSTDKNVNQIIYQEHWMIDGMHQRDNGLHHIMAYDENGKFLFASWNYITEEHEIDEHEEIRYIIPSFIITQDISWIMSIFLLGYKHQTVGHPKYGFIKYVKDKCSKQFFNNNQKEILQISSNAKKYLVQHEDCLLDLKYKPTSGVYPGGEYFLKLYDELHDE